VGVKIDDTGRHRKPAGIEDLRAFVIDPADGRNTAVADGQVGRERRHAGTIVDSPTFND
jgi:hypothetical protein